MKIGILTYHRACNYGAYMQAYCLCSRLNEEADIQAELIDFHMEKEDDQYDYRKRGLLKRLLKKKVYDFKFALMDTFVKAQDMLSDKSDTYLKSNSVAEFSEFVKNKYDVIIVGSDEVWKLDGFRGFPTPYWLEGDLGCKKFSYAASSRSSLEVLSEEQREKLHALLQDFDYISVRDDMTYDMVTEVLGSKDMVSVNCDPSFLWDVPVKTGFLKERLHRETAWDAEKKNILVMMDSNQTAGMIRQQLASRYNLISVCSYHEGYMNLPDVTPLEWLSLIAECDLVITSYFHGVCFSIMKNTPFLATAEAKKRSKLDGLLKDTSLAHRYFDDEALTGGRIEKLVEAAMKKENYAAYVEEKRKGFPEYLNKLREVCK